MGAFLKQPIVAKNTHKYQHHKIRVVTSQMQGWRKQMEDAIVFRRLEKQVFFFAVFDGHGGGEVAHFAARHLPNILQNSQPYKKRQFEKALTESFRQVDQLLHTQKAEIQLKQITQQFNFEAAGYGKVADSVGCTANVVLLVENTIYCANTGDSRSALSRNGQYIPLSKDHKPTDPKEQARINAAGYSVQEGRINGHLNLSRCLGDLQYKRVSTISYEDQPITYMPDIQSIELTKEDDFIIMGCDGVWQRYEENGQGLIDIIRQKRMKGLQPQEVIQQMLTNFLGTNPKDDPMGCDNMSAIIIEFNKLAI